MFENVDRRTDAGVTGILIAHLRAFGSGELKTCQSSVKFKKKEHMNIFTYLSGGLVLLFYI